MKSTFRKLATLAVALLVVSTATMTGFGPVPDRATPVGESDAALLAGAIIGAAVGSAAYSYLTDSGVSREKVNKLEAAETDQQQADLYVTAAGTGTQAQQSITQINNFIEDSTNIASIKAKTQIAKMLNNGTTNVSKISSAVNTTIEDYYALRQDNLLTRWNTTVYQLDYVASRTKSDADLDRVIHWMPDASRTFNSYNGMFNETGTLSNGTTRTAPLLNVTGSCCTGSNYQQAFSIFQPRYEADGGGWYNGTEFGTPAEVWSYTPSNSSLKSVEANTTAFPFERFTSAYHNLADNASMMKANYDPSYIETVVAEYKVGDVNTSEIAGAEGLASEWSTDYNQTGESVYKWASLTALGLEAPDLDKTAAMRVSYDKKLSTRHVKFNMTEKVDSNPLEVTVEYPDGSQITETVYDGSNSSLLVKIPETDGYTSWSGEGGNILLTTPNAGTINKLNFDNGTDTWSIDNGTVQATEVERQSVTEWGFLFAQNAPSGGWNASTEYDASAISGTEYFAPKGENTSMQQLVGNFTLEEIQNDDGQNITQVTAENYNYQSTDASNFTEDVTRLENVTSVIEEYEPTISGGGGLFPSFGFDGAGIPIAGTVVLVGIVFLLGRSRGPAY